MPIQETEREYDDFIKIEAPTPPLPPEPVTMQPIGQPVDLPVLDPLDLTVRELVDQQLLARSITPPQELPFSKYFSCCWRKNNKTAMEENKANQLHTKTQNKQQSLMPPS